MSQRRTNYASEKWCINLNKLRDEYAEENGKYNKAQGKYVISNEAFGQYLGIGTTSVFDYCGGYKEPSLSQFTKIAKAFNVSLDWLTGQPGAVRSANTTVQEICKYTGLSDKAVEILHTMVFSMILLMDENEKISEFNSRPENYNDGIKYSFCDLTPYKKLSTVINLIIENASNINGEGSINLISKLYDYLSYDFPEDEYIILDEDGEITTHTFPLDENGNPYKTVWRLIEEDEFGKPVFKQENQIISEFAINAKSFIEEKQLKYITEELKNLRESYQEQLLNTMKAEGDNDNYVKEE